VTNVHPSALTRWIVCRTASTVPPPRRPGIAAAVVHDQREVAEAVLRVVGEPGGEQHDADAGAGDHCEPLDRARTVREHRRDREDERDRRQVELDCDEEEQRHRRRRNERAVPLEHDEEAPQQRDGHKRQIVLLPQVPAVQHGPRRGREQRRRDERDDSTEPRTHHHVGERDRCERQDGDRHGREQHAVVDADDESDDVDVERRVRRAGARGETDGADVALDDVVGDPERDRLVVVELCEPEMPEAEPGRERDERSRDERRPEAPRSATRREPESHAERALLQERDPATDRTIVVSRSNACERCPRASGA
jgi:hypothetical protein